MARGGRLLAAALVICVVLSCGKRGNPQPPLRPVPAAVGDAEAWRTADRVELRFTVPATNADGSTPASVGRVEIYRFSRHPDAPPPTLAQMLEPANLTTTIAVRPSAPPDSPPGGTPDSRPAPGDRATFVDRLPADKIGTAEAPVLHYVVVGVTGTGRGRKGPSSPLINVPLSVVPQAPSDLTHTYDEKALKLAWKPGAASQKFLVYEVTGPKAEERKVLTGAPLDAPELSTDVEFGRQRCFAVTAVVVTGRTTIESGAVGPECVTPVDRFAPPAPTKLTAFQTGTSVTLTWTPVDARDLGGYLVLRGDGTSETLQPLLRAPIAETSYDDKDVRPGVTYVYAVVAVDKATPPNQSESSTRATWTVR